MTGTTTKPSQTPSATKTSRTVELALRGPTGPKTQRGKMKSRYNAIKHGIFAKVVLRGNVLKESKAEYLNLLESFRESLQPFGGLEEFLVEKLAQIAWRKARAVRAEAAVVMKQTEFLSDDRESRLKSAAEGSMLELARLTGGIARRRKNPYRLAKAVQLLEILQGGIEARGFEPEVDERILESLYGGSGKAEGLFLLYRVLCKRAKEDQDKPPAEGPSAEGSKQKFLQALEEEIKELQHQIGDLEAREAVELPLIEESLAVPDKEELDRLLRYEARLDGSFDRTLAQLERLQRMRLGQPLPPPVKVELSR